MCIAKGRGKRGSRRHPDPLRHNYCVDSETAERQGLLDIPWFQGGGAGWSPGPPPPPVSSPILGTGVRPDEYHTRGKKRAAPSSPGPVHLAPTSTNDTVGRRHPPAHG
jgi:hypothetical protein